MKKIIISFDPNLIEHYEASRRKDIFAVLVEGLKEYNPIFGEKTNSQIDFDIDTDAENKDIIGLIAIKILELNEQEFYGMNVSIYNFVPETGVAADLHADNNKRQKNKEFSDYLEKIDDLREFLEEKVYGQQHVIDAIVTGLVGIRTAAKRDWNSPVATFTFVGPHTVGKSYTARLTLEYLQNEMNIPGMFFNKVQYENEKFVSKMLDFVDSNKRCVLVFDDAEFIDSRIALLFRSIFTTGEFARIDFSNTILIFTSSLGRSIYERSMTNDFSRVSKDQIAMALYCEQDPNAIIKGFVDPIIVDCLEKGQMVMFNHLDISITRSILIDAIQNRFLNFEEKTGIKIKGNVFDIANVVIFSNVNSYSIASLVQRFNELFDAEMNQIFTQKVNNSPLLSFVKEIEFVLDTNGASEKVINLFEDRQISGVVFTEDKLLNPLKDIKVTNVDLVFATTTDEVRSALANGASFALIDPLFGAGNIKYTDLDDADSLGNKVFNTINDFYNDCPIYLLANSDKFNFDDFKTYLDKGAKDVIFYKKEMENFDSFESAISFIRESIELEKDIQTLIANSQILTYNSKQVFDKSKLTVAFSKLNLSYGWHRISNKALRDDTPNVRFDDVIGHDRIKNVLSQYKEYILNAKEYVDKYGSAPNGVLLYGGYGLGKRMLANAFAGETRSTLINFDFYSIYSRCGGDINVIAREIHNIFANAINSAPSVLLLSNSEQFFDYSNLDGISVAILNILKSELYVAKQDVRHPVFVIATANALAMDLFSQFTDMFDKSCCLQSPTIEERELFIRKTLEAYMVTGLSDKMIHSFAIRNCYSSFSYLKRIIEFIVKSSRGETMTDELFIEKVDQYDAGEKVKIPEDQMEQTAYHEVGHLLLGLLLGVRPSFVTIVPRESGFLGYTSYNREVGELYPSTRQDYLNEICIAFGGRAAELIINGEKGVNSGISGDIKQANWYARLMICGLGMGKHNTIYPLNLDTAKLPIEVVNEINEVLDEQYDRAIKLLEENKDKLVAITKALVEKESLIEDEFLEIYNK